MTGREERENEKIMRRSSMQGLYDTGYKMRIDEEGDARGMREERVYGGEGRKKKKELRQDGFYVVGRPVKPIDVRDCDSPRCAPPCSTRTLHRRMSVSATYMPDVPAATQVRCTNTYPPICPISPMASSKSRAALACSHGGSTQIAPSIASAPIHAP